MDLEVCVVQVARREQVEGAAAAGGNKRENRRWRQGNYSKEAQQRLLVPVKGLGSPGCVSAAGRLARAETVTSSWKHLFWVRAGSHHIWRLSNPDQLPGMGLLFTSKHHSSGCLFCAYKVWQLPHCTANCTVCRS